MPQHSVLIGFKAHLGWLACVAVAADDRDLQPLAAQRLDLFADQPREVREPYHVAGGWLGLERVAAPADPLALIERVRQLQDALAAAQLAALKASMAEQGLIWQRAALLVGRGIVHTLEDTLSSHAHIHIAEGEAVRDAARAGLTALKAAWANQDEKDSMPLAAAQLGLSSDELDQRLKQARPAGAKSWTKEHRTIAAAAWVSHLAHSQLLELP